MKIKKNKYEKKLRGKKVKSTIEQYKKEADRQRIFANQCRVEAEQAKEYSKCVRIEFQRLSAHIRKFVQHSALLEPTRINATDLPFQMHHLKPHRISDMDIETLIETNFINMYLIEAISETDHFRESIHFSCRLYNPHDPKSKHYECYMVSRSALEDNNPHAKKQHITKIAEEIQNRLIPPHVSGRHRTMDRMREF